MLKGKLDGGKNTEIYPGKGGGLSTCKVKNLFLEEGREICLRKKDVEHKKRYAKRQKGKGAMVERHTIRNEFVQNMGPEQDTHHT